MLGELGVSAKTNLVKVKGLFDAIDKDDSGELDSDELTRAHPVCCAAICLVPEASAVGL